MSQQPTLSHETGEPRPPVASSPANRFFSRLPDHTLSWEVATLYLVAHVVAIKRRLNVAERNIQTSRDVVLGVDGVSLR